MFVLLSLLAVSSALDLNGDYTSATWPTNSTDNLALNVIGDTVIDYTWLSISAQTLFTGTLDVFISEDTSFEFDGGFNSPTLTSATFVLADHASLVLNPYCFRNSGSFEKLSITSGINCTVEIGAKIAFDSSLMNVSIQGNGDLDIKTRAFEKFPEQVGNELRVFGFKTKVRSYAFSGSWLDTLMFDPLPDYEHAEGYSSLNSNRASCPLYTPNFEDCELVSLSPTVAPTASPTEENSNSRVGAIVGGSIAGVLVIGGAVYFFRKKTITQYQYLWEMF